jgi:hypothetical protein
MCQMRSLSLSHLLMDAQFTPRNFP